MEFALSEDQRLLQDSIRGVIASASPLDEVRKVAAGEEGVALTMTSALANMGTPQLLVPEAHGGLGLGALEAALVQEVLGGHVCPAQFIASNVMATEAIKVAGSNAQQAEWLPRLADHLGGSSAQFGVALTEHINRREGAGLVFENSKLSGKALFALEAGRASHILTCDQNGALYIAVSYTHLTLPTIYSV